MICRSHKSTSIVGFDTELLFSKYYVPRAKFETITVCAVLSPLFYVSSKLLCATNEFHDVDPL